MPGLGSFAEMPHVNQTITRRQMLTAAAVGPFIRTSRAADRRPNFLFLAALRLMTILAASAKSQRFGDRTGSPSLEFLTFSSSGSTPDELFVRDFDLELFVSFRQACVTADNAPC